MGVIHQVVRSALLSTLPRRLLVDRAPRASRRLYLTFDDGPHPQWTPRLLEQLRAHCLRATFFVVGQEAQRFPGIVRQIVDEGHAIGTHSWRHAPAKETTALDLAEETLQTAALIHKLTGVRTRLFRPPYGALSAAKLLRTWKIGHTVVLWSCDPRDYQCTSGPELEGRLRLTPPLPGDIVLLHDCVPAAGECIPLLADFCAERGLETGTLGELLPSQIELGRLDVGGVGQQDSGLVQAGDRGRFAVDPGTLRD
jgi:peptidoglycan/xylan/chitin deacetylase (PgdA/CDA1 family)